ncbi:unnamed protein product [Parnassius apollo]|uniref:(apollo) hypothetical protein n=1 Tax=Parnassius apollo TaxID=110799 RepID=A0A8S3WTX4_PARAO|nr:unnamed protein product [Parnassius apollo]
MAEDLRNYKLQLQQVEAALLTDPENEELLKLKTDLEEVIELTQDLIKTQEGDKIHDFHSSSNNDNVAAPLLADDDETLSNPVIKWHVGERCLAKWKADGMFYEATIEEIGSDSLKVKFDGYTTFEVVSIHDIKSTNSGVKRPLSGDESKQGKGYNREYLKKKKQKKQQRFKQIEEERESEKNKWLSFHSKSLKKPGVRTKSIFASPDNLSGRVGIGTCGISGKPMTEYTPGEKWKKGG